MDDPFGAAANTWNRPPVGFVCSGVHTAELVAWACGACNKPAPEAADEAPAAEDADGRVKGAAAEERDDRESEAAAG